MLLVHAFRSQRLSDLYEVEVSLIYVTFSRIAKATW